MKALQPLLKTKNLQKYFPVKKSGLFQFGKDYVKANKDITLTINEGEILGIVGESGCGKSTFGRTLIQLHRQTGGSTLYYGESIEDFVPKYVKEVYQSLPKVSDQYDQDYVELKDLEAKIDQSTGSEKNSYIEELRLKNIAFDETYGNILRLVGGLVAHDNLNEVSQVLINRYEAASELAKLKRELDFEQTKQEMNAEADEAKIARMTDEIAKKQVQVDEREAKLEALRASLRGSEKFDKYEQYLDDGIDLAALTDEELRILRKDLQIIFQNPYSSLDPRLTVGDIIGEGLLIHKFFKSKKDPGYTEYIIDIMEKCGLDGEFINRYPHQFSGGQRQRIGIARALAVKPKFVVADEAVSALDVSIQSQIINLLIDLKETQNLTYLFITHDLSVVRYISDRIGVMYFGRLVEISTAKELFDNPVHPYTKRLLNAIPSMDEDRHFVWNVDEEYPEFEFFYDKEDEFDSDWIEVGPDHFVATTLKDREGYYRSRKEGSHELARS